MAELKNRWQRLNELSPEVRNQGFGSWPHTSLFTDDDIIPGSNHFFAFWVTELPRPAHGPHTHDDDELLVFLGSDPDNIHDLGCEVEISMGPEMEKHTFSESTLVYIPAGLVHCPIRFRNMKRPFLMIQAVKAGKLTERPRPDLVPEAERGRMVFFDFDGRQTDADFQQAYAQIQEATKACKANPDDTPLAEPKAAGTKYGKNFTHNFTAAQKQYKFGRLPATVIYTDDDTMPGCHQFWALWIHSLPWPFHGPHNHQDPESMVIIGADWNDPADAGLTTEDYMGMEMEKYVTDKSNLIFMPGGFVHGPIQYRDLTRPFIMVQCHYAPKLTEKSFKHLAPPEYKGKMVNFDLKGTEGQDELDKARQYT